MDEAQRSRPPAMVLMRRDELQDARDVILRASGSIAAEPALHDISSGLSLAAMRIAAVLRAPPFVDIAAELARAGAVQPMTGLGEPTLDEKIADSAQKRTRQLEEPSMRYVLDRLTLRNVIARLGDLTVSASHIGPRGREEVAALVDRLNDALPLAAYVADEAPKHAEAEPRQVEIVVLAA